MVGLVGLNLVSDQIADDREAIGWQSRFEHGG
jgi:hypothetical protein